MALINLQEVSLGFGGTLLLDRVNLQIEAGERIGLLGRNGEGKSTLLKILAGVLSPDCGKIIRLPELKTAMLMQEVPSLVDGTVNEVVTGGLRKVLEMLARHHAISVGLAVSEDQELLTELDVVQHELDVSGGWQAQQRVATVLSRLQLKGELQFSDLSGGMKRRVMLARALVLEPDLLLLDEPTNHLDIDFITWLEKFLLTSDCTLLFVTHDRQLLKKLANRILDLDRGRLTIWPGNYQLYLERKDTMLAVEADQQARFDKKLSHEEAWIREGIKARRTRNQGRVRALLALRYERQAKRKQVGKARLQLQEAERSGRLVVRTENISWCYGEDEIIRNFTATILRGDKIGIIGPNGCGKTTLLKLLLGQLTPTRGVSRLGVNLHPAYFDQLRSQLDEGKTVGDNVVDGHDTVIFNGRSRHIISYLKDFLFTPDRIRSPVNTLSGGERNRLLLAKLFTQPANILVLDEPTNDLDIETLELLEELLFDYQGTVLLVSHDRDFLNNVVTSTLVFEGDGHIQEYAGGYDDWLLQKKPKVTSASVKIVPQKEIAGKVQEKPRRLTFKEKQELDELPQRIEVMEEEQRKLYNTLADPAFYKESGADTAKVKKRLAELEETLQSVFQRWEELEVLADR